jgi:hypothetical protein
MKATFLLLTKGEVRKIAANIVKPPEPAGKRALAHEKERGRISGEAASSVRGGSLKLSHRDIESYPQGHQVLKWS